MHGVRKRQGQRIRGCSSHHFTFCWSARWPARARGETRGQEASNGDRSHQKSASSRTGMHGVKKSPGQRIRGCSSHHFTFCWSPRRAASANGVKASKERERWQKNARCRKTFRPTHKRCCSHHFTFSRSDRRQTRDTGESSRQRERTVAQECTRPENVQADA